MRISIYLSYQYSYFRVILFFINPPHFYSLCRYVALFFPLFLKLKKHTGIIQSTRSPWPTCHQRENRKSSAHSSSTERQVASACCPPEPGSSTRPYLHAEHGAIPVETLSLFYLIMKLMLVYLLIIKCD